MKNWITIALALSVAGALSGCKKEETAAGTTGDATSTTGGTTGMSSGSSATTAPAATAGTTGGTTAAPATTGSEAPANVSKIVGDWEMVLPQAQLDAAKKAGGAIPSGVMTIAADGKFTMTLTRGDKTAKADNFSVEGTAKVDGSKLELTATMLNGKAPDTEADKKPQVMKISDDGSTLTAEDNSLSFKRKS